MNIMTDKNENKSNEVLKFGERKEDAPKPFMRAVRFTEELDSEIKKVAWRYHRDYAEVVRDCVALALPVLDKEYKEIAKRKLDQK